MNLTFKVKLMKEWTLLDDSIIYGGKEILLADITKVKEVSKARLGFNGVIQITAGKKVYNLTYDGKSREDGEKALAYLLKKCAANQDSVEINTTSRSIEEIREEIKNLSCNYEWGTKKEVNELPKILSVDEHIKALTSGNNEGNTWLIVCTNKRVIMMDKGMLFGLKLIDIPLDRITSISHSKGLILGKIAITDGAVTRVIENVTKETAGVFADIVNKEIEIYKQSKNTPAQVINNVSAADELLKFKGLLDAGVITQEEFDAKKKQLLNL